MENEGKTINSEGFPEGEAWGTSWGIYRLSWVFYIRMLFSLKSWGQEFVLLSSRLSVFSPQGFHSSPREFHSSPQEFHNYC